jgi:hypothetical protein
VRIIWNRENPILIGLLTFNAEAQTITEQNETKIQATDTFLRTKGKTRRGRNRI